MLVALSPTTLWVIGHAENVRKGLRQFMEMDEWTERRDKRATDGWMYCLFIGWLFKA